MVNFVVDDKIVIKCHQPWRTVLANLDVAKSLFQFVLRRSEEFRKSIELARVNPIELSVIYCSFLLTGQYAAKNQCLQEEGHAVSEMRQAVRVSGQILVPRIIECACLHPRRLSWQETLTL